MVPSQTYMGVRVFVRGIICYTNTLKHTQTLSQTLTNTQTNTHKHTHQYTQLKINCNQNWEFLLNSKKV